MNTDKPQTETNTMLADVLRLEILQYNYWEHYKYEKDISMVLPIDHPKRILAREATSELLKQIHFMQNSR